MFESRKIKNVIPLKKYEQTDVNKLVLLFQSENVDEAKDVHYMNNNIYVCVISLFSETSRNTSSGEPDGRAFNKPAVRL